MAVLDSALGGKVRLPLQFLDRWGHSSYLYLEDCSKGGEGGGGQTHAKNSNEFLGR